jgi:hypothetical protein
VELLLEAGKLEISQKSRDLRFQDSRRTGAGQPSSFFMQIAKIFSRIGG